MTAQFVRAFLTLSTWGTFCSDGHCSTNALGLVKLNRVVDAMKFNWSLLQGFSKQKEHIDALQEMYLC